MHPTSSTEDLLISTPLNHEHMYIYADIKEKLKQELYFLYSNINISELAVAE